MGMYTELHYNTALKEDIPKEIITILQWMLEVEKTNKDILLPDHPLFHSKRVKWMLQDDSYCFDADTHSTLRYDLTAKQYYLCIRCNLKNYENEIENFISWIHPYIDKEEGEFLGFYRYEEKDVPTLIYA